MSTANRLQMLGTDFALVNLHLALIYTHPLSYGRTLLRDQLSTRVLEILPPLIPSFRRAASGLGRL